MSARWKTVFFEIFTTDNRLKLTEFKKNPHRRNRIPFFFDKRPNTKKAPEKNSRAFFNGAGAVTRTPDPRITNALLYQLSYTGTARFFIDDFKKTASVFFQKV